MTSESIARADTAFLVSFACALACPVVAVQGLVTWCAWRDALRHHLPVGFVVVLGLLVVAVAVGSAGVVAVVAARRRAEPLRAWILPRLVLGALVASAVVYLLLFPLHRPPYAHATAGLTAGLVGWTIVAASRSARWIEAADLAATLLFTVLLGGELALRGYDLVHPTYLLSSDTSGPRRLLAARRLRPGDVRHGFPVNSRGDYDEEFHGRAPGERLVVVVGDSMSVGTVPVPLNFTSVAERELGVPAEVYNMAAPGIGPPEYLELLLAEALPMLPDLIVVGLFVGNDLVYSLEAEEPRDWLHAFYGRDRVLLLRLFSRLRLLRDGASLGLDRNADGGEVSESRPSGPALTLEEALAAYPRYTDPLAERPTFTPERFLSATIQKASQVCDPTASEELPVFAHLERIVSAAGDVPLLFLVNPDECQVEDAFWDRVVAAAGRPLERDRPQRLLARWFSERDQAFLDLLPAFRAVPPLEDGERHLFLLRSGHRNARGDEAAGKALAAFLRDRLR